jgi:hypothetical protein
VTDLSRAEQIAESVQVVRALLGDRDAAKVEVSVSRGGTYTIRAETAEGDKVALPALVSGRGK